MVAVDVRDDRRGVEAFYRQGGWQVPTAFDVEGIWRDPWAIVATPTTYVVDPAGRIVWRQYGFVPGDEAVLERVVNEQLARPGGRREKNR